MMMIDHNNDNNTTNNNNNDDNNNDTHLFEGAFQDTRGRLTKQSGKGTTSSVCPMGITDLEGLE